MKPICGPKKVVEAVENIEEAGIDKVETFYDREQLVEFIHGLK